MGIRRGDARSESGQATIEYVGLVLLVAVLALASLAAIGDRLPGGELARAIVGKLVCAVRGGEACSGDEQRSHLARAYGEEIAALVEQHAPRIAFEDKREAVALPVDFRRCRERRCSDTDEQGDISRSRTGEPATAFVHVVDCREGGVRPVDADCSGSRAGRTYFQYWLYYPDSTTRPFDKLGKGFHPDDWESYQLRIDADGALSARASSHKSYNNSKRNMTAAPSDVAPFGRFRRRGWDASGVGDLRVSVGSQAGSTGRHRDATGRRIPADALRLVPLSGLERNGDRWSFAVTPPWRKVAWTDPETDRT